MILDCIEGQAVNELAGQLGVDRLAGFDVDQGEQVVIERAGISPR